MSFHAFDRAVALISALRAPLVRINSQDPDLARQIRRAASSVALNLGEGRRRVGRDRGHMFRVAAGSAGEVVAAVRVAEAWGYVDSTDTARPLALCDEILAMLWRLTH